MTVTPVRMRLSRAKGFRLQEASLALNGLPAVNCARPGSFGNPFTIKHAFEIGYLRGASDTEVRDFLCACFKRWLGGNDGLWQGPESDARRLTISTRIKEMRGHNCACWCRLPEPGQPDHCHAAVLLEIANR